jgi:hypothetical protein
MFVCFYSRRLQLPESSHLFLKVLLLQRTMLARYCSRLYENRKNPEAVDEPRFWGEEYEETS